MDRILSDIGLSRRELRARLDLVPEVLIAALPSTLDDFLGGVVPPTGWGINGRTGAGKTSAMVCLLRAHLVACMERRRAEHLPPEPPTRFALWVEWPRAAHLLRANAVADPEAVAHWVDSWCKTPILVLDDLGSERRKGDYQEDYACGELDYVISTRYRDCRPTWYTTNLDAEGMIAMYGARMTSRLIGENPLVEMVGQDRRVSR